MQEALTTPATRTRCARTSTGSPTFPRRKGGTGGWSWGLVVRGAAKHLEDHPKVALRCEVRDPGAAELTAEDHFVLTLGPLNKSHRSSVWRRRRDVCPHLSQQGNGHRCLPRRVAR